MISSRKFVGKLLAAVYWLMPLFGRGINAFSSAAPSGSIGTTSFGNGALVAGLTGTTQFDATTGLKFADAELHSLKSPCRILFVCIFFFKRYGDHRDLHSFPTRRH